MLENLVIYAVILFSLAVVFRSNLAVLFRQKKKIDKVMMIKAFGNLHKPKFYLEIMD